jgi:uncharacterized protein YfaQ (DUF2300 family)
MQLIRAVVSTSLLGLACAVGATVPARLAWLKGEGEGATTVLERTPRGTVPAGQSLKTPLGSVWKLFVYGYLVDNAVLEPVYRCAAAVRDADDGYCCDPGGSIGRDQALAQSCGPYFDAKRLGIAPSDWQRYWQRNAAPGWLRQLGSLRPETEVPVSELLVALRQLPAPARTAARQALLPVAARMEPVLAALGSGPRFKTWSWKLQGESAGGAAGWLADGTPFWFGGSGTSKTALDADAAWIASQWAAQGLAGTAPDAAAVGAMPCIEVAYFQRYPIRQVTLLGSSQAAPPGPMRGRYRVTFVNSQQLVIEAVPAQILQYGAAGPHIEARLPLEDYVARVVDREGDGRETQAARALAVAARSYVLQNAAETEACRTMADDSRSQRVSPNPPSAAARAASAFTEGLVVQGTPVRYHRDQASPGVMSWQAAVASGRQGASFVHVLNQAFPAGTLGAASAASDCTALPEAQHWLAERQLRWRQRLRTQAGYEPLDDSLRVCQLAMGTPHSDQRRLVVRVREWQSREGRVTLIHEYLHLAFRNHPRGQDEIFIEQLAQQLADL